MVSLDRHLDYRHAALAGELLAAAARPPMPDAIRLIVMGAHAGPPPLFAAPPLVMRPRTARRDDDVVEGEWSGDGRAPRDNRSRSAGHPARSRSGLRCLLPRPGVQRAVSFGDFKNQLGAQLAHPERLRDTHRLPCCVQLYRVIHAQPRLEVARRLLGAGSAASDLLMFTPEVARRLQLPPPRHAAMRSEGTTRESPWLDAGEEVVELRVIHDHTQEAEPAGNVPVPPRGPAPIAQAATVPAAITAAVPTTVVPPADAVPAAPAVRTTVPGRFLASPAFPLTREEALFDMTVAASAHGLLAGLRRLARRLRGRGELERWRALLDGHERDEQLWQVRPPKVALTDHRSREWVRRALTLGGYDTGHMLREWELYWRRRGV